MGRGPEGAAALIFAFRNRDKISGPSEVTLDSEEPA